MHRVPTAILVRKNDGRIAVHNPQNLQGATEVTSFFDKSSQSLPGKAPAPATPTPTVPTPTPTAPRK